MNYLHLIWENMSKEKRYDFTKCEDRRDDLSDIFHLFVMAQFVVYMSNA